MTFYQELAETARSAILARRARDAAHVRGISELCAFDDDLDDGKVAETISAREAEIIQQINELDCLLEGPCAVEPTPTPPQHTHQEQPRDEERTERIKGEGKAQAPLSADEETGTRFAHVEDEEHAQKARNEDAGERAATSSLPQFAHTAPAQSRSDASPYRRLLRDPRVQRMIAEGRAQKQREETRRTNRMARNVVPQVPWKRATQEQKFQLAGHSAASAGGFAFSLNLSERTQKNLRRNSDPLRAFTHRVNKELKARGLSGMPYAVTLEQSDADQLHVHGFAVPHHGSEDALKQALRAAGGAIPGKAGSRQLSLSRLSDGGGCGWASYCEKHLAQTDKVLAGRARRFLSTTMAQIARDFTQASTNMLRTID